MMSCKSQELVYHPYLLIVVIVTTKYLCTSIITMYCMVCRRLYKTICDCSLWVVVMESSVIIVLEILKYTVYQVSLPCIIWFASLRIEEVVIVKVPRPLYVDSCHGNNKIHMCNEFRITMYTIVRKFEKFRSMEDKNELTICNRCAFRVQHVIYWNKGCALETHTAM